MDRSGHYKCSDTWETLREVHPNVRWWKIVWSPTSIHCHSFLVWLVLRDALVTKQRMSGWSYTGKNLCLFCYGVQESRDHPLCRCSFSRQIWTGIMTDCSFLNMPLDWENIKDWAGCALELLCTIYGGKEMISCTTILHALRKQSWLVLSGKLGLGSWLKVISSTSIIL